MLKGNKHGAIELSIGTVVIIVLAMSMLVLGLVLVGRIFGGATNNVDELNKGVQDKIKELFQDEEDKSVIYLTERTAEVKKGKDYGIAFGIRNIEIGTNNPTTYTYKTTLRDPNNIEDDCGVGVAEAEEWIKFGNGDVIVRPGDIGFPPVPLRVQIPESAPLCTTSYKIEIEENNVHYDTLGFILKIVP